MHWRGRCINRMQRRVNPSIDRGNDVSTIRPILPSLPLSLPPSLPLSPLPIFPLSLQFPPHCSPLGRNTIGQCVRMWVQTRVSVREWVTRYVTVPSLFPTDYCTPSTTKKLGMTPCTTRQPRAQRIAHVHNAWLACTMHHPRARRVARMHDASPMYMTHRSHA